LLSVRKNTANIAVIADLGRYPLFINIASLAIKHWVKLLNSQGTLAYDAYVEDRISDGLGGVNWVTFIRTLLSRCNLQHVWESQSVKNALPVVKAVTVELKNQYENLFFERITGSHGRSHTGGNKLRTYAMLKSDYQLETYVSVPFPTCFSHNIARIRTGSHDLEIERGRWAKIPAGERYCRHCKTLVEDEVHFVTVCTLFDTYRRDLYKICNIDKQFQTENDIFITLFKSNDVVVLKALGNFIMKAFGKRKTLLYDNTVT
jgi:hypothetical protein